MTDSAIPLLRSIALCAASSLAAAAAEFGTLQVTQLANVNDNLDSATPGISISQGPGGSDGGVVLGTANRGDYNMDFGRTSDTGGGVLLGSVAGLSRDDSATGGPATGDFSATSSLAIDGAAEKYWIAVHWAEVGNNLEANHDVAYLYLPFDEFPGGVATNTANNGPLTLFTGSPGLGGSLTDPGETEGIYELDLSAVAAAASREGVLLVTGARNEDNYALSRANPDGSFTIYCHDNGANGRSYENDGVGFGYLAASAAGTRGLIALGRVNGDATTDVAAGNFSVSKGPKGRWYLSIPGHTAATGTLIVSPEGGDTNNVDNILATGWDAAEERWIIESRDLTGVLPQTPALQDMARADEDAFSFAFFAAPAGAVPEIAALSPADAALKVAVNADLSVEVAAAGASALEVTFHGRRVSRADPRGDFSVVALPDTQFYSQNTGGNRAAIFSAQTDWIVAERDARNIGFVLHLGDITQYGDNPATAADEWANASAAMYRLEDPVTTLSAEGVPYIVAVGNHDQSPIGDADGTTTNFNTYFGVHPQTGVNHFAGKSYYGDTSEPGSADNHYTLFTAGGIDFIVISLEYDTSPDAADLAWADGLLKAHPARRGIVITHYLVRGGNPAPFGPQGAATYEALKDNPNLILMHGGHIHGEGRRADSYNGHTIHSVLADYQGRSNGGDGWLRIMEFRPALNRIDVRTYSPVLDQFETDEDSEFSLDVDLSGGMGPFTEIGRVTVPPGTAAVTWEGLEAGTRYEWYATVSDGARSATTPVRSFVTDGVLFAPTVGITGPANGSQYAQPADLVIEAEAADMDGTIARVDFYSGTGLIGSDPTAPYSVGWNGVPAGSYTVIAKAIDNDGQESSSTPIAVQVTQVPAAPDVSTVSGGLFNPGWAVAKSTLPPRQFDNPGDNAGDIALKINGNNLSFHVGIIAVTNWENPGNGAADSADNLAMAYASSGGNAWISVLDNANPNAGDANPATSEESAGVAVAFLPYAAGWTGASVTADAAIVAANLPAGASVRRTGDGLYAVAGLSTAGNLLAFPNGNGGLSGDNVVSVRGDNGRWLVDVRDNSGTSQNGDFSFVYLPEATPGVVSGMIRSDGGHVALNGRLGALGATVVKSAGYFELMIGDGTVINPATSALFMTGDSTGSTAAADNITSYSASGNSFRIFTQDLPNLDGSFQAIDLRFVAIPFDPSGELPPTVEVFASDANGGEHGNDQTLAFTLTRGGPTVAPLAVSYLTGGTAVPGIDFTALPGAVEIPAGQASVVVPVTILPDDNMEGDETVILSLVDGALYHPGAASSAGAVIRDRPLQAYLHAGGLASPEGDDDGDGLANLLEYYMGTAAADPASKGAVRVVAGEGGAFTVRFPHAKAANDLQVAVEWSTDLSRWHRSGESDGTRTAGILTRVISPVAEDPETVEAVLTISAGPVPDQIFIRLAVAP